MRAFVANTDYEWYRFLEAQDDLEEVNFWKPSGKARFGYLSRGEPFFFKLRQAYDHAIVGFGLFGLFRYLRISEAWDVFGSSNGAATIDDLWTRIARYVSVQAETPLQPNHTVGCILLSSPVFFPKDLWVQGPRDWSSNIVAGKGYDTSTGEGKRIWADCLNRLDHLRIGLNDLIAPSTISEPHGRYGPETVIRPRLGQGIFRYAVEDAYGKCAVTREHSLPALEAAHIVSYSSGGRHEVPNGMLLRADIHKLFDKGYVTITPNHLFRVSHRLADEYHNGKVYYQLEGREIWLPENEMDRPNPHYLERHNDEVFVG